MKKLNLIIGKRQIIISSLVLILGIAVYLNWQFASGDQAITVMDVLGSSNSQNANNPDNINNDEKLNTKEKKQQTGSTTINKENEKIEPTNTTTKYGEAELVFKPQKIDKSNLAKAELEKQRAFDEKQEELKEIIESSHTQQNQKATAASKAANLTGIREQETAVENQIKEKGLGECVVTIKNGNIYVLITTNMTSKKANIIRDIITNTTKIPAEKITINTNKAQN